MSQILFDENTLTGHLAITENRVTNRQRGRVTAVTDNVMRSAITGIEVKKGVSLLGMSGNWKIMIHRTGGGDLVIESIKPSAGKRVLSILQYRAGVREHRIQIQRPLMVNQY
jgi:hypothetical protein